MGRDMERWQVKGAAVAPIWNRDLGSEEWGTFVLSERWARRAPVPGACGRSSGSTLLGMDGDHVSPVRPGSPRNALGDEGRKWRSLRFMELTTR